MCKFASSLQKCGPIVGFWGISKILFNDAAMNKFLSLHELSTWVLLIVIMLGLSKKN